MGAVEPGGADRAEVSSELSGRARDVVQARDVSGGIHYHAGPVVPAAVPRMLRADVAGFVGREEELERLARTVADRGGLRLAVVAGTAGAGKTSLALRFAHRVRAQFPDGDLFVNLQGYDVGPPLAPAAALERFLRALGVPGGDLPADLEDRAGMYRSLLAGRRILVVLDNAATAGQVRPLLPGDGQPLVVVTSRSRLSGLTTRDGARRISLGLLDSATAVDLFQAATGEYRSLDDAGQVAELAELCARLPLALRIAAERAAARPLMPLGELIAELSSGQGRWAALSVDGDQEADAVRAVFAWSYRALPASAARTFRLLGLHPGPEFGVGAAAALWGCPTAQTRSMLDVLTGAHLLEQTGPARFQLHDLLRAFAADVAEADEPDAERQQALERLVHWYLYSADAGYQMLQNLEPSLLTAARPADGVEPERFTGQSAAVDWYAIERANLQALLQTLEQTGQHAAAWRLAATIQPLLYAYGSADDRMPVAQAELRAAEAWGDASARGRALRDMAIAERLAAKLEPAGEHYRQALTVFSRLGDTAGRLYAANGLGLTLTALGEFDQAAGEFTEAVKMAHANGNVRWAAVLRVNLAEALFTQGHLEAASDTASTALRDMTDAVYQGTAFLVGYRVLASALTELGRWDQAASALNNADRYVTEFGGDLAHRTWALVAQADLALATGQHEQAHELLWQAENLSRGIDIADLQATILTRTGQSLLAMGRASEAVDFHRQAVALRRNLPVPLLLAEALIHLARAHDDLDQPHQATIARQEAAALLAGLTYPRATSLRAQAT
ncbi:tetratricopeptide (TPR) repeat protein [Catenulispora sp. GAS73]|uniref:ATP-binding protein n=1 Tax=Catenulispora sp. GAS73 TaxID=3156269 RepID=UPI00351427E8